MLRLSILLTLVSACFAYLTVATTAAAGGGGGGACRGEQVSDTRTESVEMRESCLFPVIARVDPGASVTWTNRDPVTHTVTGANMSWGSLDAMSGSAAFRFDEAGVYPYYCVAHPWMAGVVVVGDASGPGLLAGTAPASSQAAVISPEATVSASARAPAGGSKAGYFLAGALVSGIAGVVAGSAGFALGRSRRAN